MILRALADTLLSMLLAPPCAICGRVLAHPLAGAVCEACWASIDIRPSSYSLPAIARAASVGLYEATLRDVIHALKYDGRRSIAPPLAALMRQHCAEVLRDADVVVPVALHPRRRRHRGFNQADDLARGLGVPMARVLERRRVTQPQVDLPAHQRRANVAGAFALRAGRNRAVRDCRVVLVDDVATTGATLEACARVLRSAGAHEVRAITAARVPTGRPHRPLG